jgi:hypothetical protein
MGKQTIQILIGVLGLVIWAMIGCTWDEDPYTSFYENNLGGFADRGGIIISEVMWAGSYDDAGTYYPDDDFIEIQNQTEIPVNMSGWYFTFEGVVRKTVVIPQNPDFILYPDAFFIVANNTNHAFPLTDVLHVALPHLTIPDRYFRITIWSAYKQLGEPVGISDQLPMGGSTDGYTARSMERDQDYFTSDGVSVSSWYTYSASHTGVHVAEGYRTRTFASPGEPCQSQY